LAQQSAWKALAAGTGSLAFGAVDPGLRPEPVKGGRGIDLRLWEARMIALAWCRARWLKSGQRLNVEGEGGLYEQAVTMWEAIPMPWPRSAHVLRQLASRVHRARSDELERNLPLHLMLLVEEYVILKNNYQPDDIREYLVIIAKAGI